MTEETNEQITTTAKDTRNRTSGEKEQRERSRVHRSIYLERTLYDRLGDAYKTTSHELYPQEVRKSTFIEACIAYALDHLADIKTVLRKDQ